jgi:hypothetical protein
VGCGDDVGPRGVEALLRCSRAHLDRVDWEHDEVLG